MISISVVPYRFFYQGLFAGGHPMMFQSRNLSLMVFSTDARLFEGHA